MSLMRFEPPLPGVSHWMGRHFQKAHMLKAALKCVISIPHNIKSNGVYHYIPKGFEPDTLATITPPGVGNKFFKALDKRARPERLKPIIHILTFFPLCGILHVVHFL